MKRANLIFLGIGVVVVLLLFLTLIPVREGAITRDKLTGVPLNQFNAMITERGTKTIKVTPTTNTSAKTKK